MLFYIEQKNLHLISFLNLRYGWTSNYALRLLLNVIGDICAGFSINRSVEIFSRELVIAIEKDIGLRLKTRSKHVIAIQRL
jgi:hypothetical protein